MKLAVRLKLARAGGYMSVTLYTPDDMQALDILFGLEVIYYKINGDQLISLDLLVKNLEMEPIRYLRIAFAGALIDSLGARRKQLPKAMEEIRTLREQQLS